MDAADLLRPTADLGTLDLPTTAQDARADEDFKELSRERERVRDLLRYYTPVESPPPPHADQNNSDAGLESGHGTPLSPKDDCAGPFPSVGPKVEVEVDDDTPPERLLANDPTLTAFAQLGAFRLNCQRSFISLMDQKNQYILAEATRSVSLNLPGDTAVGDEVYLGARVLDMVWGVCPNTIQVFTALDESKNVCSPLVVANQKCYVMNDLSAIEAFKNRPYVAGWPYMRFYAEVPIHSPTGHIIGTYCVVDDKPRDGLDDRGLAALNEIANAIMKHLHLVQMQHGLQRAREMIDGLGKFIDGKSSESETLEMKPRSIGYDSITPDRGITSQGNSSSSTSTLLSVGSRQASDLTSRSTASPFHLSGQSSPNLAILKDTLPEVSLPHRPQSGERVLQAELQESIAAQGVRSLFLRAGGLVQEALHLDGVLFVKVCKLDMWMNTDLPGNTQTDEGMVENPRKGSTTFIDRRASAAGSEADLETQSDLIASTLYSKRDSPRKLRLPQATLRGLLRSYPSGHIFLLDEESVLAQNKIGIGRPHNEAPSTALVEQMWTRDLLLALPHAKAVIFYPLWDAHRGEWFAASLAWTCDPQRVLQAESLTYLAAFGSSIMSEKSRIDALRSDRAKAEFISSVSHELRSPLHGILAGTEALQANPTASERDDMIRIVTVCGEILLETVDQILEYSKFSNPTAQQSPLLKSLQNLEKSDISVLVENVLDGVVSGYKHRQKLISLDNGNGQMAGAITSARGKVTIILTMEWRSSWVLASHQGQLKRILINLFGNSLKYTPSGFIHVSLRTSAKSAANQSNELLLQIEDSGIGMSKSYLENKLYTPFIQENPQAAGTGLGLSIVRQLVHDVGGNIEIRSEVGYGTVAKVTIPASPTPENGDSETKALIDGIKAQCRRLRVRLLGFDMLPNSEKRNGVLSIHKRRMAALTSSITSLLNDWFEMGAEPVANLAEGDSDLVIALQSQLQQSDYLGGPRPLIILEDGTLNTTWSEIGIFRLSQPVGPRKLARVLSLCLEYQKQDKNLSTNTESVASVEVTTYSDLLLPGPTTLQPPNAGVLRNNTEKDPIPSSSLPQVGIVASDLLPSQQITTPLSPELNKPSLVLLVEDNPINLKILMNHMRRAGQDCMTAQNGLEALELYHKHHSAIKLIFMDISMPVMDGLSSTQSIRLFERECSLPRTRIVAVTCFSSQEYQEDALKSGVDMFLVKPVPMKSLQPILDLDPRMEIPKRAVDG